MKDECATRHVPWQYGTANVPHLRVLAVAVQGAVPLLAGQNAVQGTRGAAQAIVLSKGGLHIPGDPVKSAVPARQGWQQQG